MMADELGNLIAMLSAVTVEDGCSVFDHTAEEIGMEVVENHAAVLTALIRPTPSASEDKVAVSDGLVEELAKPIHEALSRANVMAYLDMPHETPNDVARAILPIIHRREQQAAEASKGWLLNIRRFVEDKGPRDEVLRRLDLAIRSTEVGKGAQ